MTSPRSRKDDEEREDVVFDAPEGAAETEIEDEELRAEDALKKLREKLALCQKERQEFLDGWQRLKADTLNSKKRQDTEREREREREIGRLVERLIPLCDSFDMALKSQKGDENGTGHWQKGMEQIYSQLHGVLRAYNVTIIAPEGMPFNPAYHEAVFEEVVHDEKEHHTIRTVLQNGYAIGEYLIRPAKVIVGNYKSS